MIILLGFAFLAGIVTILSPCILPILPVVLSGSVSSGKTKPFGIIVGFVVSFTFFTLFLTTIVRFTGISTDFLRFFAAVVLIVFGISLFVSRVQIIMEQLFTKLSRFAPKVYANSGFIGGFLIGLSIGLIWTPCVGPIMAAVIALAATSTVTLGTFLITLFYSVGSAVPMFFIMIGGRNLLGKIPSLVKNTENIQKGFGVIMILLACTIFLNWDRNFENFIAATPYGVDVTNLENNTIVKNQLQDLHNTDNGYTQSQDTNGLFNENTPAPDFVGISKWLNLQDGKESLSIKDLKGKVVLVDFWTYTCINCIRTLPFVTSWYDKYKDKGFVVIGVHTPEFQFEHETANVANAISRYNIHYPVAQDNNYATWQNYTNEYWPAEYLIDANGVLRRTHFGEGEYDQTEMAIRQLLKEAGKKVTGSLDTLQDQTPQNQISPETYLGANRMQFYYPTGTTETGMKTFTLFPNIPENSFSFGGEWNITPENAVAGTNAILNYHFIANKVFIILRPAAKLPKQQVKVFLDGKAIDASIAGTDVTNGVVTIDSDRLYHLVDLHGKIEDHILQLEFLTPGISAYTFTFG